MELGQGWGLEGGVETSLGGVREIEEATKQWPKTDKTSVKLSAHFGCVPYCSYGLSGSWVSLRDAVRENGRVSRCRPGCLTNTGHSINVGRTRFPNDPLPITTTSVYFSVSNE